MKRAIDTPQAPKAISFYSQGTLITSSGAGQIVFTAGQVAIDPATNTLIEGDVARQTEQVMKNLEAILAAAGLSLADVVKTTVYLTSIGDFTAMSQVYARHLQPPYPARSTVAVRELPLGALVEIEAVAVRPA